MEKRSEEYFKVKKDVRMMEKSMIERPMFVIYVGTETLRLVNETFKKIALSYLKKKTPK